jgi:hypothetical protein
MAHLVLLSSAHPASARAQTAPLAAEQAERLFQEAISLLERGEAELACPKLTESQRLDPSTGTLLLLSVCLARTGHILESYQSFQRVAELAAEQSDTERLTFAREQMAQLEPRLARLILEMPVGSRVDGLSIRLGEQPLSEEQWLGAVVLAPGSYELFLEAPGFDPQSLRIHGLEAATTRTVRIPTLRPYHEPAREANVEKEPEPAPARASADRLATSADGPMSRKRRAAFAVAGVGLASLATAGALGLRAYSLDREVDRRCPGRDCEDLSLRGDYEASRRAATFANVGLGVGALSLSAALYLFLTSKPARPRDPRTGTARAFEAWHIELGARSLSVRFGHCF